MWNISCANPAVPEVAIYSCGGIAPPSVPPPPRSLPGDVTPLSTAAQIPGSAGFGIGGLVRHICVQGSTIMWSAEEPLVGDAPGIPVGIVYMFDPLNLSTLAIKVFKFIVLNRYLDVLSVKMHDILACICYSQ